MSLNDSIRYQDARLYFDAIPAEEIAESAGTPIYVYSLRRALGNYRRLQEAFAPLNAHIHYSAKANANLALLRALVAAGAGVDAVSGGEIYKALHAGAAPEQIVFAGVGKTWEEIQFALERGVGWFNVENVAELAHIDHIADHLGKSGVQVALRLNPDISANTHPNIATGHGAAKFGLTRDVIAGLLARQRDYPKLRFTGVHVHIGSQLGDTSSTTQAVEAALELIAPYPQMRTVNIGGGFPARYRVDDDLPTPQDFAQAVAPLLQGYEVFLEPGRSIVADAGVLLTRVLYVKEQAGQRFVIVDASMTELLRPMLYGAQHTIVPIEDSAEQLQRPTQVVGPVCETTDVLGRDVPLLPVQPGDVLAVLTTGAYGAAMASRYNARPLPAEAVVSADGETWDVVRQRETWNDLLHGELE